MSNKIICTYNPFFFLEYLFVIHFVHQFSYPHQNCSGSLNSVLRRCDNKVYFARQASASLGYFMRQTSIEEVLKVFLLLKYFTMFYLLINFLVNDSLLTGLLNTMIFRVAQLALLLPKPILVLLHLKVLLMQEHHVLLNLQGQNQSSQIQWSNQWLRNRAVILVHLILLHLLDQADRLEEISYILKRKRAILKLVVSTLNSELFLKL